MKTAKYTYCSSPVGALGLAATDNGIFRLDLKIDPLLFRERLEKRYHCRAVEDDAHFTRTKEDLEGYFNGKVRRFDTPIDFIEGTNFQRKVWMTLMKIPYGQVRSYAWVAKEIGSPQAVRAVGQANARNPVAIIVPCHRVINSNGDLGGYGSGVEVKVELLRIEGINPSTMKNRYAKVHTRFGV